MVNLPLRKNFAPIASNSESVLRIMEDMRSQQKSLSSILGGIDNVGTVYSDNLVDTTNMVNRIISSTNEVIGKLSNQQNALATIQSSTSVPKNVLDTLNNELSQLRTASSQISNQATKLNNIISKGLGSDELPAEISKKISNTVESFSSNANNLISGLDKNQDLLSQVISKNKSEISGIIGDNISDINIDDIFANFTDFSSNDEIASVIRESDQIFNETSEVLKGTINDLKTNITDPISSKVTNLDDFKKITNNITGAIEQTKAGLTNLKAPISQLGDVSAMIDDVMEKMTNKLGTISTQATNSFTDQFAQIKNIAASMDTVGQEVNSNIDTLSDTIDQSLDEIGGGDMNTGLPSGISSLTNISDPASSLSATVSDMNNLSHELILTASSLSSFAIDFPTENPITDISNKLMSIGQKIYDQTLETPGALNSLVTVTEDPGPNVGSIEKAMINSGSSLTSSEIPNIKLNINSDKMANDLVNQVLIINDNVNSSLRS